MCLCVTSLSIQSLIKNKSDKKVYIKFIILIPEMKIHRNPQKHMALLLTERGDIFWIALCPHWGKWKQTSLKNLEVMMIEKENSSFITTVSWFWNKK